MKRNLLRSAGIILISFALATQGDLLAQTSGTFSFSVTTTSSGGFSPRHLLAIWIQNNNTSGSSSGFVKTKIKYGNNSNTNSHLQTWLASSAGNTVDAATGSTLTTHGSVTFLWNGTDVAGTLVPDGEYYTWLEMAWSDNQTTGKTVNSFPFTKGATLFSSTPTNTANFQNLSLTWTPLSTGIEGSLENEDIILYPNPSDGHFKIDFKKAENDCFIQVFNESGALVHNERIPNLQAGTRSFDLTALPAGIYYCTLHLAQEEIVFRIVLAK
ncbi:MAG: T9SS type A sorting domain-containing protein [Bacteroidia bacterium]|nr:MAG: T9SS type A sorting domain-containing protein [Bacteroidia bacterium]